MHPLPLMMLLSGYFSLLLVADAVTATAHRFRRQIDSSTNLPLIVASTSAVLNFIDIMDPDVFARTSVDRFMNVTSAAMRGIQPIVKMIETEAAESADAKLIYAQFREARAMLDCAQGDISEILADERWKFYFSAHYSGILVSSQLLEDYFNLHAYSRRLARAKLVESLERGTKYTTILFDALVGTDHSYSGESLAQLAARVAVNRPRKVMSFLLAVSRVLLRGAELSVASQVFNSASPSKIRQLVDDWHLRLGTVARQLKMVNTDLSVKSPWQMQMEADLHLAISKHRELDSARFTTLLYEQLRQKFYWRHWMVLVFTEHSKAKIRPAAFWFCLGTGTFLQVALSSFHSVIVASSDANSSQFSRREADRNLAEAELNGPKAWDPSKWLSHVSPRFNLDCASNAFIGAICWGCRVEWTARPDRLAHREMSRDGHYVNFIVFG